MYQSMKYRMQMNNEERTVKDDLPAKAPINKRTPNRTNNK